MACGTFPLRSRTSARVSRTSEVASARHRPFFRGGTSTSLFRLFSIYGTSGNREMPRICFPTANPPRRSTRGATQQKPQHLDSARGAGFMLVARVSVMKPGFQRLRSGFSSFSWVSHLALGFHIWNLSFAPKPRVSHLPTWVSRAVLHYSPLRVAAVWGLPWVLAATPLLCRSAPQAQAPRAPPPASLLSSRARRAESQPAVVVVV